MEKYVMNVRIRMPEPRKHYIVREECNRRLDAILQHKLTLIRGGAGSGKTTLITTYLTQRKYQNFKWISLDENSNDLYLFWDYVMHALASFMASGAFMEYFNAGISRDALTQMLEMAVDGLADSEDILLILDDFQAITDADILESFSYLLRHASKNLHIVLLTRQDTDLYLAGMCMDGSLLMLTDADLKFSEQESVAFLQYTMGLKMEQSALHRMAQQSQGWVGGLQLLASAYQMGGNTAQSLLHNSQLVTEYITHEIYAYLSPEQQTFMVKTSVLSYFSQDICQFICPQVVFTEMLESLSTIFILCMDTESGIYQYHPILGDYLQAKFHSLTFKTRQNIHQNAATAFLQRKDYEEGIRHLLANADYTRVIEVVLSMPTGMRSMRFTGLVPVEAAKENFDFVYQKFFYHYINLDFNICREIYTWMASCQREELQGLQGLGFLIDHESLDWTEKMLSKQDIERLPIGAVSKALVLIKNATMLYYQMRYDEALELLSVALMFPNVNRNSVISYFVYHMRAQVFEDVGRLQQAMALYLKMEELLADNTSLRSMKSSFYIGKTGIYLKQMQLEAARICLQEAANGTKKEDWEWFLTSYQYNQAELYFVSDCQEQGNAILQQVLGNISPSVLVVHARLVRCALASRAYSPALLDFVENAYLALEEALRTQDCTLLYAHCLLLQGREEESLSALHGILAWARQRRVYLKIVEVTLLKLRILMQHGAQARDLRNLVYEAVHYACDDEIFMPFYFAVDLMTEMDTKHGKELRELLSQQELTFYQEILTRWGRSGQTVLSTRELEVLEKLAQGGSNKSIAQALCISLATVKTHINNIYGKLQVNSRISAVEKARALQLLP